ncbi:MAG: hypothetical protein ABR525_10375 [Candidatus Limnocylindria bacterium]
MDPESTRAAAHTAPTGRADEKGGSRSGEPPARTPRDFGALWLPLMRSLTAVTRSWLVWKNADAALAGIGDIDSAAMKAEWPEISTAFRAWAAEERLLPTTVCPHIPGGLNLLALPADSGSILELGVKETKVFRGSILFRTEDLLPLAELDARGFRRLRPGAEGVFKLVLNGARPGGRADEAGLAAKDVRRLLRLDPEGARLAAPLFGPAAPSALAAASAAAAGGWDRRAMMALETWAILRGPRHPRLLARRAWFRLRGSRSCPIVRALLGDHRRIPGDRPRWLAEVRREHVLHGG